MTTESKIDSIIGAIKKYALVEKNIEFAIDGEEFNFELEDVKYHEGKLVLLYKEKLK
jgi:hypothetical protein